MGLTKVQQQVLKEMVTVETWSSPHHRSARVAFYRRADGTAVSVLPATVQSLVRQGWLIAVESDERHVVYERLDPAP